MCLCKIALQALYIANIILTARLLFVLLLSVNFE